MFSNRCYIFCEGLKVFYFHLDFELQYFHLAYNKFNTISSEGRTIKKKSCMYVQYFPKESWKHLKVIFSLCLCRLTISVDIRWRSHHNGPKFHWSELAGARGHTGGAAHGTRREDGAFGPRETASNLLLEVGDGSHDGRYFQSCCQSSSSRGWCGSYILY